MRQFINKAFKSIGLRKWCGTTKNMKTYSRETDSFFMVEQHRDLLHELTHLRAVDRSFVWSIVCTAVKRKQFHDRTATETIKNFYEFVSVPSAWASETNNGHDIKYQEKNAFPNILSSLAYCQLVMIIEKLSNQF